MSFFVDDIWDWLLTTDPRKPGTVVAGGFIYVGIADDGASLFIRDGRVFFSKGSGGIRPVEEAAV